jgi:hypothetical protein
VGLLQADVERIDSDRRIVDPVSAVGVEGAAAVVIVIVRNIGSHRKVCGADLTDSGGDTDWLNVGPDLSLSSDNTAKVGLTNRSPRASGDITGNV